MRATSHGLNREPNVVPMIDILLVLLIIFMLIAMYQRQALELQLPVDSIAGTAGAPIVLSVEPGPRYTINGGAVEPSLLHAELRRIYDGRLDKVLFVKGAPTVKYQEIITAFDIARGAGVRASGVVLRR